MHNGTLNMPVPKLYISEDWMFCSKASLGLSLANKLIDTSAAGEYI